MEKDTARIIDFLVERSWLTRHQAEIVRERCRAGANLRQILASTPVLTSSEIGKALDDYQQLISLNSSGISIKEELRELFPYNILLRFHAVPISNEGGVIRLATARTLDADELIALQKISSKPVELVIVSKEEVNAALDSLFA